MVANLQSSLFFLLYVGCVEKHTLTLQDKKRNKKTEKSKLMSGKRHEKFKNCLCSLSYGLGWVNEEKKRTIVAMIKLVC